MYAHRLSHLGNYLYHANPYTQWIYCCSVYLDYSTIQHNCHCHELNEYYDFSGWFARFLLAIDFSFWARLSHQFMDSNYSIFLVDRDSWPTIDSSDFVHFWFGRHLGSISQFSIPINQSSQFSASHTHPKNFLWLRGTDEFGQSLQVFYFSLHLWHQYAFFVWHIIKKRYE